MKRERMLIGAGLTSAMVGLYLVMVRPSPLLVNIGLVLLVVGGLVFRKGAFPT